MTEPDYTTSIDLTRKLIGIDDRLTKTGDTLDGLMQQGKLYDLLRELNELRSLADDLITATVADARHHGYSWTDIGSALDTTKQGAQQRYGRTQKARS